MLATKRKLLAACSVALTVFAAPAFANSMSESENPKGPQISKPAAGSYASVPPSRGGRAQAVRGKAENAISSRNPLSSLGGGSSDTMVVEARRYIGTNPTNRRSLWCGAFMNLVLERTGHPRGSSDLAKSFASYGTRVSGPQVGAIAVMSRGEVGGHVGVVTGIDPSGDPIIISGNHNNTVAESVYSRGRIFAYVVPDASGIAPGTVQHASADVAVGNTRKN